MRGETNDHWRSSDPRGMGHALAELPERQRTIFLAVCQDRLTYADLAVQLGVTTLEVEHELAQALALLADALDEPKVGWPRRLFRWVARKFG